MPSRSCPGSVGPPPPRCTPQAARRANWEHHRAQRADAGSLHRAFLGLNSRKPYRGPQARNSRAATDLAQITATVAKEPIMTWSGRRSPEGRNGGTTQLRRSGSNPGGDRPILIRCRRIRLNSFWSSTIAGQPCTPTPGEVVQPFCARSAARGMSFHRPSVRKAYSP